MSIHQIADAIRARMRAAQAAEVCADVPDDVLADAAVRRQLRQAIAERLKEWEARGAAGTTPRSELAND